MHLLKSLQSWTAAKHCQGSFSSRRVSLLAFLRVQTFSFIPVLFQSGKQTGYTAHTSSANPTPTRFTQHKSLWKLWVLYLHSSPPATGWKYQTEKVIVLHHHSYTAWLSGRKCWAPSSAVPLPLPVKTIFGILTSPFCLLALPLPAHTGSAFPVTINTFLCFFCNKNLILVYSSSDH